MLFVSNCCVFISKTSEFLGGYIIGYELLPINGLITFIGLHFIKKSPSN